MGDIIVYLSMGIMQRKRKKMYDEKGENFKSNVLSEKADVEFSAPVGVLPYIGTWTNHTCKRR